MGVSGDYRIAVLDDFQMAAAKMADWRALDAETVFFSDHVVNVDILARRLADFDVVVAMKDRTRFDDTLLRRLPRLKLIAVIGNTGNAAIDGEAAARYRIEIAGRGGPALTEPLGMPSFTWALILALTRNIVEEANSVRSGGWQTSTGSLVEGQVLGVLGLGRIGRKVARIGEAFGMEVIAWSQNLTPEAAVAAGARWVSRNELFAQADIVTIHLKLSDRTRGLVDAAALACMKHSARLINTSRGDIVDEGSLVQALQTRQLAGAALDTFSIEPLPADHPFRTLPNVLATPHIGFVTEPVLRAGYQSAMEAVRLFLARAANSAT